MSFSSLMIASTSPSAAASLASGASFIISHEIYYILYSAPPLKMSQFSWIEVTFGFRVYYIVLPLI